MKRDEESRYDLRPFLLKQGILARLPKLGDQFGGVLLPLLVILPVTVPRIVFLLAHWNARNLKQKQS